MIKYLTKHGLIFLSFFFSVSVYAEATKHNNLPEFMAQHGYQVIPFTVVTTSKTEPPGKGMMVPATLCHQDICIKTILQIDLGSPEVQLHESLIQKLKPKTKSLQAKICLENRCIENNSIGIVRPQQFNRLGLDFLRKLHCILDLKNNKIYIPNPKSSNAITAWLNNQPNYQSTPLHFLKNLDYIVMPTRLNKLPAENFLFDTGDTTTLIDTKYAKQHDLQAKTNQYFGYAQPGKIGISPLPSDAIQSIKVGSLISPFIPTLYATDLSFVLSGTGNVITGVIGFDWMQGNHAIIDLENNQLSITVQNH